MKTFLFLLASFIANESHATLTIINSFGSAKANGELILRDMTIPSGAEIETSEGGKVLVSDSSGNKITILNSSKVVLLEGSKSLGVKLFTGAIYSETLRSIQILTPRNLIKMASGQVLISFDPTKENCLVVPFKGRPMLRVSVEADNKAESKNFYEFKEMTANVIDRSNIPTSDALAESQSKYLQKVLPQIGQSLEGFSIERADNVVDLKNHSIYNGEILETDRQLREELAVEEVLIKPGDEWSNMFNFGLIKSIEFYSVLGRTQEIRSKSDGLGFKAGYNFSTNFEAIDFSVGMVNVNSQITECIGCLKSNLTKTSTDSLIVTQLEYSKLINKFSLWGAKLSGEQGIFYSFAGVPSKRNVFKGLGNYGYILNPNLTLGASAGIGKLDDLATGFSGEGDVNYKFDLKGEQFKAFFKVMYERYEGNNVIYKSERFHLGLQVEF